MDGFLLTGRRPQVESNVTKVLMGYVSGDCQKTSGGQQCDWLEGNPQGCLYIQKPYTVTQ